MLYVYPFAELHPETYARCLRQPHSIISWHDGQVVGEAALTGDDPGNIWVSLPAEAIDLLRTSGAYFVVTETFVPGDPPTLVVKGEFSPV